MPASTGFKQRIEAISELEDLNEGLEALAELALKRGEVLVAKEMRATIALNLMELERLNHAGAGVKNMR
jgi:hypothetical protein